MKRLSVLLDDMAYIRSTMDNEGFDPVQMGVLAETAGASGLVCTYTGPGKGISERDVRVLKEIRKSYFNLRIPAQEDAVHLALSVVPDMVTFVQASSHNPRAIRPLDITLYQADIEQFLPDLQASSISVSVLLTPDISNLRVLSKVSVDYVELETSEYTLAPDINEELVALDKIRSAAVAAAKLGLGVNCSGNIGYDHIASLAQISSLEDIIVGKFFIRRALWVGVEKATTELLQLIRYREVE